MDRSQAPDVHQYIGGITYPVTREQLIAFAESHGAGDSVLRRMQNMGLGTYDGPDEVSAEYSYLGETGERYGHVTVYDQ